MQTAANGAADTSWASETLPVGTRDTIQTRPPRLGLSIGSSEIEILPSVGSEVVAMIHPETVRNPGYKLKLPIPVLVEKCDGDYVASLPSAAAGIGATGDSLGEALANMLDICLAKYGYLAALPQDELGPIPRKQLAFLQIFVCRS
jgi:predicted RNase H-like HicB family nuclease